MKRPARHCSSPMELALQRNPQAQWHCEAFWFLWVAAAQRASSSRQKH